MEEKPKIVVTTRTRRPETTAKQFAFTAAMVPGGGALREFRQHAWETFNRLSLPTTAEEAWRRTDLRALPADQFRLPEDGLYKSLPAVPGELLQPLAADAHGGQIVLLPGGASVEFTESLTRKGVIFTDLRSAERDHPDLLAKIMGAIVRPEEGKFAALAATLSQNGVVLYVPKGVSIDQPLHSILWGPGEDLAHLSHILVWVDEGASVTYVHESASPDKSGAALHAGIVEIKVADGASLKLVELQSWGRQVWNFSHERAQVGRDANLDWIFGAVGSRLTKNFSDLDLVGEGATGRMSGFYFIDGIQHLDHDTQQNHLAPHTTSDLLFKGALKGSSRSVWQGMIYVAPGAQKTDGYQANRNLILSQNSRADSIPGLEILADDVRCTHGATVGKLEKEPLFYLKSRGIPDKDAERLLVEGFFDPIMQRISFEGVRARFQQAIHEKTAAE
ncbi:MAG: Fe-S cluster assembly protein SufD [Anaerolineales bacterium]|nr:Fe-S cluster assembly protein SufD [Anaerolineales bacterium]